MPTTRVVSAQDGVRLTVNMMVKQPTLIPARIMQDIDREFLINAVLRKLPNSGAGVYVFNESTPLFAEGDAEIVEEFGEIPVVSGRLGARKVAFTVKRALAMMVSQEMINRNDVDRVNTQIKQIRNTFIRTWERQFILALINHPDVPTMPASVAWDMAGAKFRTDITEADLLINGATNPEASDELFGFASDMLIIGERTKADLIQSDDFNKVFRQSPLADQAPEYKGELPGQFYGKRILVSREMDRVAPSTALLLESKTVGGIGDERPMAATPMYPDRPRETYRSDVVRQSAVVIDQPKAAVKITGLGTP